MGVSRKKAFIIALFGAIIIGSTCWFIFPRGEVEPQKTRVVVFRHALPEGVTHYTVMEGLFGAMLKTFEPVPFIHKEFSWSFTRPYDSQYSTRFRFTYYREIAQNEFVETGTELIFVNITVNADGQVIWGAT